MAGPAHVGHLDRVAARLQLGPGHLDGEVDEGGPELEAAGASLPGAEEGAGADEEDEDDVPPASVPPEQPVGNIVGTSTDLAELMVLAQAGKVTLHTRQYPLDRAVDAIRDLDAGRVRGRAILVP